MKKGMMVAHLWRTGKRAAAVALIGLMVAVLAVPEISLAATDTDLSGIYLLLPDDGVGDSPIMP